MIACLPLSSVDCSPPDPLATQLAQLLCESDEAELEEAVRRWVAEAPTAAARQACQELGSRLIEMKLALRTLPAMPSRQELEFHLTLMLRMAATHPGATPDR
jgi:hypothetical protein